MIKEKIDSLLDKSVHVEKRQFFYSALLDIRDAINTAVASYEKERKNKF